MRTKGFQLAVFVFVLFLTLAVGMLLYTMSRNDGGLSASEKREILSKIGTNPSVRNESVAASVADATSSYMALDSKLALLPNPNYNSNSYSHTVTTTTTGDAFESCKALTGYGYNYANEYIVESYSYYDEDNNANKFVQKDINGNLIEYSLSSYDSNQSESIYYRGGSFAIKTVNTYPIRTLQMDTTVDSVNSAVSSDEAPVKPEVAPETSILPVEPDGYDLLDNRDVLGTETIGGKEYYIIETNYYTNCDDNYSYRLMLGTEDASDTKVLVKDWVNTETYEFLKSETYINNFSSSNLVIATSYLNESSNVNYSDVANNFEFEYNVPLKEIVYDESDYAYDATKEIETTTNTIVNSGALLLVPSDNSYRINYLYANDPAIYQKQDEYTQYTLDKSFYPNTALGMQIYSDLVESYNAAQEYVYVQPVYNLEYLIDETNYISVNISAYSATDSLDRILQSEVGEKYKDLLNDPQTINITVAGQQVSATLYTYSYDYAETYSTEGSGTNTTEIMVDPVPTPFVNSFAIINLNNRIY
ncbi:hypothetical protein KC678_05555, partial [Candidatus Dojkabacteria bacterium]|nr:hypothetical protein [Candidatus Dojkabacteria bacterium]